MGLYFVFVGILVLLAAAVALYFMTPRQQAIFVSLGTAGLDLLGGAVLGYVYFMNSGDGLPGVPASTLRFFATWCLLEGTINLGLAAGIASRLPVCALIAASLHTLGCVVQVATDPKSALLLARVVLTAIFWRAYFALSAEQADIAETQRRRQEIERLRASARFAPPPVDPPRTGPPSERPGRPSARLAPRPEPAARPLAFVPLPTQASPGQPAATGRLIGRRAAQAAPAAKSCPGCQGALTDGRCAPCGVVLPAG